MGLPLASALSTAKLHLLVRGGDGAGTSFAARDGLSVGRHPLNDVCLNAAGVAAHHAVLSCDQGQWILKDIGGKGLLHADETVYSVALEPGTIVQLGGIDLLWEDLAGPTTAYARTVTADLPNPIRTGFSVPTELPTASLESVLSLEATIAEEVDIGGLVRHLGDWMEAAVPAHHSALLLSDPSGELRLHSQRSHNGAPAPEPSPVVIRQAVSQRIGLLFLNDDDDDDAQPSSSFHSALCVPLVARGEVIGALYAASEGVKAAFNETHLRMLSLIAGPVASAIKSSELVRELSETNRDLLRRLAVCSRFNDDDTGYHIQRVGDYSAALARAVGEPPTFCAIMRVAAPMHDIGKIGIPQSILQKPGKLDAGEWTTMKQHAEIGEQILAGTTSPLVQLAAEVAGTHHEKWDGSGYPRGTKGDAIPISGRLVAVADVFDALTTERCYKPAFSLEKAYAILREGSGKHFDPGVIAAFFEIENEILEIREHYLTLEHDKALSERGDG